MYQTHLLIGRLGSDPEMRYTPSGTQVVNLSLAVDDIVPNRSAGEGEKTTTKITTWYRVVCWGKLAEIVSQYCAKGQSIAVEGTRLKASAYLDKNEQPAAKLELTARVVRFLSAKNGSGAQAAAADDADAAAEEAAEEEPF